MTPLWRESRGSRWGTGGGGTPRGSSIGWRAPSHASHGGAEGEGPDRRWSKEGTAAAVIDSEAPASPPIAIPNAPSEVSFYGSESGTARETSTGMGIEDEYGSVGGEARRRRQLHGVFRSALHLGGAAAAHDFLQTAARADGARMTRRAAGEERAPPRRCDSAGSPSVGLGLGMGGPGESSGGEGDLAMRYLAGRLGRRAKSRGPQQ